MCKKGPEGGWKGWKQHLGKQGLAGAWLPIEDDTLGGLDPDVLVELRVCEGQLHSLLDLLNLLLQTPHICVRLQGRFLYLHHAHHGVHFVLQDAHH